MCDWPEVWPVALNTFNLLWVSAEGCSSQFVCGCYGISCEIYLIYYFVDIAKWPCISTVIIVGDIQKLLKISNDSHFVMLVSRYYVPLYCHTQSLCVDQLFFWVGVSFHSLSVLHEVYCFFYPGNPQWPFLSNQMTQLLLWIKLISIHQTSNSLQFRYTFTWI